MLQPAFSLHMTWLESHRIVLCTIFPQALESVPHRDFLYQASKEFPDFKFRPLSTPSSRAIKCKFLRSRRPEVSQMYKISNTPFKICQYCITRKYSHINTCKLFQILLKCDTACNCIIDIGTSGFTGPFPSPSPSHIYIMREREKG